MARASLGPHSCRGLHPPVIPGLTRNPGGVASDGPIPWFPGRIEYSRLVSEQHRHLANAYGFYCLRERPAVRTGMHNALDNSQGIEGVE